MSNAMILLTEMLYLPDGWSTRPSLHGDSKTHFYTAWTVDNGVSTGCYNLDRDGFVPVNNAPITPGDILEPTNGTLSITIKIFKKKDDGDWWLYFGHDNNNLSPVGFWLSSVLTNLADHANVIAWGGYTYTQSTTPSFPKCLTPLTFLNMFDHSFYSKTFMKYC
ncbi:hypothetical protein DAI22_12g133200 [Oryza sativa Japonica Group]|nr:hypothetical protein DAI22_12g133200 [Oryza sativa Japonica Group]